MCFPVSKEESNVPSVHLKKLGSKVGIRQRDSRESGERGRSIMRKEQKRADELNIMRPSVIALSIIAFLAKLQKAKL